MQRHLGHAVAVNRAAETLLDSLGLNPVVRVGPGHRRLGQTRAAASVASAASASSSAAVERQALADGTLVHPGKYLVGKDIPPGTWQSLGSKVTDCYWEISDFQGEIMDNNFISVAPQFTINIPADAAGFTATGCSFQRIGD
jgi:hypothetical protein